MKLRELAADQLLAGVFSLSVVTPACGAMLVCKSKARVVVGEEEVQNGRL